MRTQCALAGVSLLLEQQKEARASIEDLLDMINGKGTEFDRIVVRDTIVTSSLGTLSLSPWFGQFDDTQTINIAAPDDVAKICHTLDGRPPPRTRLCYKADGASLILIPQPV